MEIAIREKGKVRWIKVNASVISTLINKPKVTALPISSDKDLINGGIYTEKRRLKDKVSLTGRNILQKI